MTVHQDTHRTIISYAILFVIGVVVVWSIANVSVLAQHYHETPLVWLLGVALGLANALSVYAFVITEKARKPALLGIALFGGMSGVLQMVLYQQSGAIWLVAVSFGWFGPVAEAVLSWLHAELHKEETQQNAAPAVAIVKSTTKPAITEKPRKTPQNKPQAKRDKSPSVQERIIAMLQRGEEINVVELAEKWGKSQSTVRSAKSRAQKQLQPTLNGTGP